LEIFSQRGYEGASIADIASGADVVASVLYHYFQSKRGLWVAIMEAETQRLVEHVAVAVPPPGDSGRRLPAGVDAYFQFIEANRDAWRLMVRDAPADPELRDLHERLQSERTRAIGALYDAPSGGSAPPRGKARYASLLATAIRSFAGWWDDNPDVPRELVVAAVVDFADSAAKRLLA
jgi:AcrR family transcriptional regulator